MHQLSTIAICLPDYGVSMRQLPTIAICLPDEMFRRVRFSATA
jgi:hypothetical protein